MAILPAKNLKCLITDISPYSYWEQGSVSDPFYGYPYQWTYNISVYSQQHSNPNTTTPYYYNALDINIGDWISVGQDGLAVRIMSIVSRTTDNITLIAEDVNRFNLFSEPLDLSTGGSGSPGECMIFSISDDGIPVVGPLDDNFLSNTIQSNLISRFRFRNLFSEYITIYQPSHTFIVGDMISPDENNSGSFKLSSQNRIFDDVVGVITSVGTPSDDYFTFKPFGTYSVNISPELIGDYGQFYFLDKNNPGKVTTTIPNIDAKPIYMRMDNSTTGLILNKTGNISKNTSTVIKYSVTVENEQTQFTLPNDSREVIYMSINGIENTNFTFDDQTKILIFDPISTGYNVDTMDEVFFIYKT